MYLSIASISSIGGWTEVAFVLAAAAAAELLLPEWLRLFGSEASRSTVPEELWREREMGSCCSCGLGCCEDEIVGGDCGRETDIWRGGDLMPAAVDACCDSLRIAAGEEAVNERWRSGDEVEFRICCCSDSARERAAGELELADMLKGSESDESTGYFLEIPAPEEEVM